MASSITPGGQEAIHPNVRKALWREVHEKLTLAVVSWFLTFDTFWSYGTLEINYCLQCSQEIWELQKGIIRHHQVISQDFMGGGGSEGGNGQASIFWVVGMILLMEEILHQLIGSFIPLSAGLYTWCKISSINFMIGGLVADFSSHTLPRQGML